MADKIFYNGQIYTMDSCRRICEAFAVCNDKLVYVGDSQNAMSYKKEDTLLIDLKGRSVLPGLGDAHLHASSLSSALICITSGFHMTRNLQKQ